MTRSRWASLSRSMKPGFRDHLGEMVRGTVEEKSAGRPADPARQHPWSWLMGIATPPRRCYGGMYYTDRWARTLVGRMGNLGQCLVSSRFLMVSGVIWLSGYCWDTALMWQNFGCL